LHHHGKPWCLGANWSGFYSLDIDHPDVIDYIKKVFHQVYDLWGFDLVKLDFLYGAAPFGNASESRAKRMKRALQLLRDISIGKEILACGVPLMPSFGLVEYSRIGCDVGLDWDDVFYMRLLHRERISTKNAIVNTVNRRQLNGRAFMNDPDVFFIRTENIHLTEKQKDDLARIQALLGGVFLTSDSPANYTDDMIRKYQEYRKLASALVTDVSTDDSITIEYVLDGQTNIVHFDCTNR
jgi:alpha-galactosidase